MGFQVLEALLHLCFYGFYRPMAFKNLWPWWVCGLDGLTAIIFVLEHQTVAICAPWLLDLHAQKEESNAPDGKEAERNGEMEQGGFHSRHDKIGMSSGKSMGD